MSKPLSTFERKMKNPKFKKAFEEGYQELLFSELMVSIMGDDDVSIRELAFEYISFIKSNYGKRCVGRFNA